MNGTLRANGKGGYPRTDKQPLLVSPTLQAHRGKGGGAIGPEEQLLPVSLAHEISPALTSHHKRDNGHDEVMVAAPLTRGSASPGVRPPGRRLEDDVNLVPYRPSTPCSSLASRRPTRSDPASDAARPAGAAMLGVHEEGMGVRRLVPVECERLMSWPDGWTAPAGVKAPDSKRYAACGDGVVANVAEWIARRMIAVHEANTKDGRT